MIAAINKVAGTPLGRKYDRAMRARYGKSGVAIAGKTVLGEFGGRSTATGRGVVSSAGARGPAQFIPSTRAEYKRKYGVDPWAGDEEAIQMMMRHHLATGIEGYNPGMPTYRDYILGQRLGAANSQLIRGGGGRGSTPDSNGSRLGPGLPAESVTLPGTSYEAERSDARKKLLLGGRMDMSALLDYKRSVKPLQDIPDETFNLPAERGKLRPSAAPSRETPLGGGRPSSGATFNISGPNPGRLQPELKSFANKVARIYGKPLTGLDGSTHSKYTVNGNVSEHYTGNATDIFTSSQKDLLRMGRAALIAAGMPRAQARRAKGGLYNVGNHQIIFLTNEGGNHYDHLHISARKGSRRV